MIREISSAVGSLADGSRLIDTTIFTERRHQHTGSICFVLSFCLLHYCRCSPILLQWESDAMQASGSREQTSNHTGGARHGCTEIRIVHFITQLYPVRSTCCILCESTRLAHHPAGSLKNKQLGRKLTMSDGSGSTPYHTSVFGTPNGFRRYIRGRDSGDR